MFAYADAIQHEEHQQRLIMAGELKVLVVEDSPNDVLLLQRAFSKGGPEVPLHFVRDGREALDYLNGVDRFADRNLYPLPTLLVLDLKLPGIDGFDIIKWVRKDTIDAQRDQRQAQKKSQQSSMSDCIAQNIMQNPPG